MDLGKAFDAMLKKVEYMVVREIALQWITNYLIIGKQYVSLLSKSSLYADVVCSVPQGPILDPSLFMLYINDISNIYCSFLFVLLADDTTIVSAHHNIDILYCQANIELRKLYNWFCLNKLYVNINKTDYILFSHEYDDPKNKINIDNIYIK